MPLRSLFWPLCNPFHTLVLTHVTGNIQTAGTPYIDHGEETVLPR